MTDLTTERRNQQSANVDALSAIEIVELMNSEDARIAAAVATQKHTIARGIELIANGFQSGGRLFYIGAGTSGRLGVLDASECPPTFSTPPGMVVGIIAGGPEALTRAIEGAEDNSAQARNDLAAHGFCQRDVLVGIATSGRTPYVIGGLQYAKSLGAVAVGLSCNEDSKLAAIADIMIVPVVGAEVITGSTRLKAGTATKMVLNMLTTGAMVLIGKTYGNLMVDLRASNEKLRDRSVRIVSEVTGLSSEAAKALLAKCDGEVKTAIVSEMAGVSAAQARVQLENARGRLRDALGQRTD